jgi:hypothetical protein
MQLPLPCGLPPTNHSNRQVVLDCRRLGSVVRPHYSDSPAGYCSRSNQCCSSVLSSTGTMARLWRSRKSWQLFVSVRSASRTIRRDCSAGSLRGKQRYRRCCRLTCGAHLWNRPSLARSVDIAYVAWRALQNLGSLSDFKAADLELLSSSFQVQRVEARNSLRSNATRDAPTGSL